MEKQNQYFPEHPLHPGETLAEKLQEDGISLGEFAASTGLDEEQIQAILSCQAPITPEIADKFEQATKIPSYFWMIMQWAYDQLKSEESL
jgi:addiction module HigA family antidote